MICSHLHVFPSNFRLCAFSSLQAQPEHGVYTVFVEMGNTKIEVSWRPERIHNTCRESDTQSHPSFTFSS